MAKDQFKCQSCGNEYYMKRKRECTCCSATICEYCENSNNCICEDEEEDCITCYDECIYYDTYHQRCYSPEKSYINDFLERRVNNG